MDCGLLFPNLIREEWTVTRPALRLRRNLSWLPIGYERLRISMGTRRGPPHWFDLGTLDFLEV